jgi:AMP deaminase
MQSGEVKTYCHKRLDILNGLFDFHQLLNSDLESHATQSDSRDFFNITKVDNHVHLAAAMTGRHLLSFILKKLDKEPEVKNFDFNTTFREKLLKINQENSCL